MLAEVAFLPGVFDQKQFANLSEWKQHLRFIKLALFPSTAASPYFICNLHAGNLLAIARSFVESATDLPTKRICLDLLKLMERAAVTRPICNVCYPGESDLAWLHEAESSDRSEPIERIVVPPNVFEGIGKQFKGRGFCITDFDEPEFANGINSSWTPPMSIKSQVESIRKICIHSEVVCIASPYIFGGVDDDTDFVIEVVNCIRNRPADYPRAKIQIHFEAPSDAGSADFPSRLTSKAKCIAHSLRAKLGNEFDAELVAWPDFLDRYIFAGALTQTSKKVRKIAIRWGVFAGHTARRGDEHKNLADTNWHLLSAEDISKMFCGFDTSGHRQPTLHQTISGLNCG